MKAFSIKAVSLMELLIVMSVIGVLVIPTIDLMSTMLAAHADYNNNIRAKQIKLDVTERITSGIREGAYIYPAATTITIPTISSSTGVVVETNSIAILSPVFRSDGSVEYSDITGKTTFTGIAYSIVPESSWNGSGSGNYVLVETTLNKELLTDSDDPLTLAESAPVDWSTGSSNLLADNFEPAIQSVMGTDAFLIENNIITFGFVPGAKTTYFPSESGTKEVDDTPYISSVVVQNLR